MDSPSPTLLSFSAMPGDGPSFSSLIILFESFFERLDRACSFWVSDVKEGKLLDEYEASVRDLAGESYDRRVHLVPVIRNLVITFLANDPVSALCRGTSEEMLRAASTLALTGRMAYEIAKELNKPSFGLKEALIESCANHSTLLFTGNAERGGALLEAVMAHLVGPVTLPETESSLYLDMATELFTDDSFRFTTHLHCLRCEILVPAAGSAIVDPSTIEIFHFVGQLSEDPRDLVVFACLRPGLVGNGKVLIKPRCALISKDQWMKCSQVRVEAGGAAAPQVDVEKEDGIDSVEARALAALDLYKDHLAAHGHNNWLCRKTFKRKIADDSEIDWLLEKGLLREINGMLQTVIVK